MKQWAGAAILLLALAGPAHAADIPFEDPAGGFGLTIPDGWQARSTEAEADAGRSLELTSPDGRLIARVTSIPAASFSAQEAFRQQVDGSLVEKAVQLETVAATMGPLPALATRYRWDTAGGSVIFRLLHAQTTARAFALSAIMPEDGAEALAGQADAIFASFRLLPTP